MEDQEQIDLEFLEQLRQRYDKELTSLTNQSTPVINTGKIGEYSPINRNKPRLFGIILIITLILIIFVLPDEIPSTPGTQFPGPSFEMMIYTLILLTAFYIILSIKMDKRIKELEKIHTKINDLSMTLEEIKSMQQHFTATVLETKPSAKTPYSQILLVSTPSTIHTTEDCEHWHQLLNTHIRVIRELELQAAAQGNEFHYSRKIELEERHLRVSELQQRIAQNC